MQILNHESRLSRRELLRSAGAMGLGMAAGLPALAQGAGAADFRLDKQVRIIVAYGAGGASDAATSVPPHSRSAL